MQEKVKIEKIRELEGTGFRVITGFAGIGLVGHLALSHIIKEKDIDVKAVVRSHLIPPMIVLADGKLSPSFVVHGDDENLFLVSNVVVPPENTWELGLALMDFFKKYEVKEFVTVESMAQAVPQGRRPVFGFGIPERDLSTYGVQTIKDGAMSGLNAVLIEEAINDSIPFVNFLVPTSLASALDFWGAVSVAEVLNRMYHLNVDLSTLEAKADMYKKPIRKPEEDRGLFGFFRKR